MIEIPTPVPELEFWNVSRTSDELQIGASSLKKIRPFLHVLRLPHNSSLFTNYYTQLYKDAIADRTTRDLKKPAEELAKQAMSLETVHLEEDTLDYLLTEHTVDGHVMARDLRMILGVTASTITDWKKREDLPMVQRGDKHLWIPTDALSEQITWQRPEGMPPAPPIIYPPSPFSTGSLD